MGYYFLFIAACVALGFARMWRVNEKERRYLTEGTREPPLRLDHLTEGLQTWLRETPSLRISLEGPIRDITELRHGQQSPATADTDTIDNMLMDVSRQVDDWLRSSERLSTEDRLYGETRGVHGRIIAAAFASEGYAFLRSHILRAGAPPLDERLRAIATEPARIEVALQGEQRVYR